MAAAPPVYDVTDLHALADDELDEADACRLKGALSATDSARVAQWRRQNEVLRAAFARVVHEPVPLSLSLLPPTRPALRAVPLALPPVPVKRTHWGLRLAVGCGLFAAVMAVFLMGGLLDGPSAPVSPASPFGPTGAMLAARTLTAAGDGAPQQAAAGCGGCKPSIRMPNLAVAGLTLQKTDIGQTDTGWSACGLYADRLGGRLALCATQDGSRGDPTPLAIGPHAVTWHESGTLYALAGPLSARELMALGARVHASLMAAP
jgi:anti-sigma factor RsiW